MDNLRKLIEDLIEEIQSEELEMDEATTTGDIAGYNTPNAFKDTDGTDEDEEADNKYIDRINQATGYKRVDENRWLELKNDESTPKQKIGRGISQVNKQLSEIETFLRWYGKIKKEGDLNSNQYWKRTQKNLFRIRERLNNIVTQISKL
jgi:septation ring formation regulator EzrA